MKKLTFFKVAPNILFKTYLVELIGLQFPSTKWWLAVNSITPHIAFGNGCWMGSNIHHVPASQVNNNNFGAGVNVIYFLTVDNHAGEGTRVDNQLCEYVGMDIRQHGPRKHICSIGCSREHPRIAVVRGSKVCYNIIEHKCMMQARTVFFGSHKMLHVRSHLRKLRILCTINITYSIQEWIRSSVWI